jgi:hypothetical protein
MSGPRTGKVKQMIFISHPIFVPLAKISSVAQQNKSLLRQGKIAAIDQTGHHFESENSQLKLKNVER